MRITTIEISNFRKLLAVRVDLAQETTLFVGANNSGKTSAILAMRRFLVEKGKRFKIQDFTISHWSSIDAIGKEWENADEANPPELSLDSWAKLLPALDIWFHVDNGELHHVSSLLPTLDWAGGNLGVRLRLEPNDLVALYREYRAAITDVRELQKAAAINEKVTAGGDPPAAKKLTLWPVNLTDFLGRKPASHFAMRAYLLDSKKLTDPVSGQAKPQPLREGAVPLDGDPLQGLIRVNEISAQRGLGEIDGTDTDGVLTQGRDSQKLSDQLRLYYAKHLDPFETPDVSDLAALQAIEAAQEAFDQRLHDSFAEAFNEVEGMGYPGVSDPRLKIASKLRAVDGLNHEAAVSFEIQMAKAKAPVPLLRLPESYNGLGYQNLISMIFRLMSFRDAWMRVGKAGKTSQEIKIEPIHLVLVEEPEAHLHAQVQQVFINKAYKVLREHEDLRGNLTPHTQLVVSTHSSHVAHETSFACLRYFRRLPAGMVVPIPVSTVINLSDVFGEGTDTERFVTRYLRAQHCDLFFADAAILVEGPAEKMLVPNFIRRYHPYLTQCYITLMEINGSHAHRMKPLIEALGLLTLVISDLDAGEKTKNGVASRLPARKAGQVTSNATLKHWAPKIEDVDGLLAAPDNKKIIEGDQLFAVRVAYQTPVSIPAAGNATEEALPSTFEDSLAFENLAYFSKLDGNGLVKKFATAITSQIGAVAIGQALFTALDDGKKAEFALDIIWSKNFNDVKCPKYISEGLAWLGERLRTKQVDVLHMPIDETGDPI